MFKYRTYEEMCNMENEYMKEQEQNRQEAFENISKWIDCYLKADSHYKNILGTDWVNLLAIKAQENPELNQRLSQAIQILNAIRS